jgi:hypothetical protein
MMRLMVGLRSWVTPGMFSLLPQYPLAGQSKSERTEFQDVQPG